MSGSRRQSRPSTRRPVNSIPNTRTMGNEKLRAFIHDMDTPENFRVALQAHLGIPSIRNRLLPPRLDIIGQRVRNIAQHRKDMVPIGTSSWHNGSPHGAWTIQPHYYGSSMIVAHIDSPTTYTGLTPSCLYRFFHSAEPDPEDQESYLDVLTHESFFSTFFSQIPFSLSTDAVVHPGNGRHMAHLPVIRVGVSISDLDAVYHIVQWIYVQDSSEFLQGLFGDGISVYAERITTFNYRTRSRARSPYRFHATLVETTLRIVRALPRTAEADSTLRRRLLRIDAVFQLADELGLEDVTFWRALSAARRVVFDVCAIRHQEDLPAGPYGPSNASPS